MDNHIILFLEMLTVLTGGETGKLFNDEKIMLVPPQLKMELANPRAAYLCSKVLRMLILRFVHDRN